MAFPLANAAWRQIVHFRRALILALVLAVVCIFGALMWLRSASARAWAAHQVESIIDGAIRGSVTIGSLDRVDEEGIGGRNIVFYDELKTPVLEADKVSLSIDWTALMHGQFHSKGGFVEGGRLTLDVRPDGSLSISRAFDSAHPGPRNQPLGEDVVRLEHLDIHGIDIGMRADGQSAFRARGVRARIRARVPENGSIDFAAEGVSARLHLQAMIPVDLQLRSGRIALDGASRQRAQLMLRTRVGGEGVRARIRVVMSASEEMHVDVRLHPESPGAVFTAAHLFTQALALGLTNDAVDVTMD